MSTPNEITVAAIAWPPGNTAGRPPQFDGEGRCAALVQQAGFASAMAGNTSIVQFVDGARTYWHLYYEDLILVVLRGECRYGSESQPEGSAHEGQMIRMPGGQRHWHEAVPGTTMTHISITTGGAAERFGRVEG